MADGRSEWDWDRAFELAVGPLGLKPAEFWELTPAELNAMIKGYNERQQIQDEDIICGAWLTATLIKQKKLPKLEKLLEKQKHPRKDTRSAEERRKEFEEIKRRFGLS